MQEGSAARREGRDMLQKSLPVEAAEAKVCQARRMEIVGQLTGGVVHDFNNILTVISGTIEILAEAVADRPDLAAIAGLITEAAARGANLTSNLLAVARPAIAASRHRRQCTACRRGPLAAAHVGRTHRDRCAADRGCFDCFGRSQSAQRRSSILRSLRATRCRKAASSTSRLPTPCQ